LGGKLKRFNNIYINNFGDEMSEDEMKGMFEPLGKLISVKVKF
jgi:polyadenylate-binding protein